MRHSTEAYLADARHKSDSPRQAKRRSSNHTRAGLWSATHHTLALNNGPLALARNGPRTLQMHSGVLNVSPKGDFQRLQKVGEVARRR
jgi:hypothetical protein